MNKDHAELRQQLPTVDYRKALNDFLLQYRDRHFEDVERNALRWFANWLNENQPKLQK